MLIVRENKTDQITWCRETCTHAVCVNPLVRETRGVIKKSSTGFELERTMKATEEGK